MEAPSDIPTARQIMEWPPGAVEGDSVDASFGTGVGAGEGVKP